MKRQSRAIFWLTVAAGGAVLAACSSSTCSSTGKTAAPSAASSAQAAALNWGRPQVVAEGEAHAGPWRMNDSRFHYVDDPTVKLAANGTQHVLWVDNRRQDIFLQKFSAAGRPLLAEPVDVSKSPAIFSWLPRIVASPDGKLFVLWQEIVFSGGSHGGETFFARSLDNGETFSEPLNLSNTSAGCGKGRLTRERWHNGSLDIARAPGGELFVAWTEYEGPLRFSRSKDGGRSFSTPLHVAGNDARPARGPSLAVGPKGSVYLAWAVGEDPTGDIEVARSVDAGDSFESPRAVAETEGYSDAPKIAVDDRGTLHLVYAERTSGFFGAARLQYTRRPPAALAFEAPRRVPAVDLDAGADFPALGVGAAGKVVVVWEHYPDAAGRAYGLGVAISNDGGNSFGAATLIGEAEASLGMNGSLQGKLMDKLDVSDTGHIAVVNSRFLSGRRSLIHLFRANL